MRCGSKVICTDSAWAVVPLLVVLAHLATRNWLTNVPCDLRLTNTYPQGTQVSNRDRDFRPARRRDFDDDNFETPGRSFGSPPGFSARRFEAPSGPPVQAVVKWYNPEKGFG